MTPENPSLSQQNDVPAAVVEPPSSSLRLSPRRCQVRSGKLWLQQGFVLYLKNPGTWMLALLVMLSIQGALFFFPIIGPMLPALLLPVWLGGLVLGCVAVTQERNFHFRHLFTGFEASGVGLLKLGLFTVAGTFVAGFCATLLFGVLSGGDSDRLLRLGDPDVVAAMSANPALRQYAFVAAVLFLVVLSVPAAGLVFAPALVVLRETAATTAIKASYRALVRNFAPILVWLLLIALATLILIAPVLFMQPWRGGVGFVISSLTLLLLCLLLPVVITSLYCMACDVFPDLRWQPTFDPKP